MIRQLIPLMFALGLSACAVYGPDYEKPDSAAPDNWRSKDSLTHVEAVPLPEMAWWQKFNDPLLIKIVDKGLEQNNNIQSAIGNVYKAKAILQQIQMNWVPTVNAGAGFTSVEHQLNTSSSADLPFPGGFSAGFIPNYSLNILQQLRNQEQAEANVVATTAAKNAVRLTIISQIVGSYFSLRAEQYLLERQKNLVNALEEAVNKYTEAHKEGLISLYTLQQYIIELNKARAELPVIEYNIVHFSNSIHVLLNENPAGIENSVDFKEIPNKAIVTGNIPSDVLKNRPDVLFAEETLKQSNANIGVNTSVFFPTIKLTTPIGMSSNSLSNLFTAKESYWQYSGGINMPIINLAAYGAIKAAKGQYYADYFKYAETIRNAFAAVDSSLSAHQKYTDSFDMLYAFFDTTEKRYQNENIRYKEGLVSYPDLLALRVTWNQAGILMAQSKLKQLISIVRLYQDMGGGYRYKDSEEAKDLGDGHRFGDLF